MQDFLVILQPNTYKKKNGCLLTHSSTEAWAFGSINKSFMGRS